MNCRICGDPSEKIFQSKVLLKHAVDYYQCVRCRFIQTEEPFWLDEAYAESITLEDTGLVERNTLFTKRTTMILFYLFKKNERYLDYGGGYGLFVRMMRDIGFDFYWNDPYTKNLFARGFESSIAGGVKYGAITSFECFEHFRDPRAEIDKLLTVSDSIIFSTEIFPDKAPLPDKWDYYYFSHGQHISLYSIKTLQWIAQEKSLYLCSNGKSFHLLSKKKINNTIFNLLLKSSLVGFPKLIELFLGSKTKTDSHKRLLSRTQKTEKI